MKDFRDCDKEVYRWEGRMIDGEVERVKVFHFAPCGNCKEDCNGKVQVGALDRLEGVKR